MENPFKVGETAPPEYFEMHVESVGAVSPFKWSYGGCAPSFNSKDWIRFGIEKELVDEAASIRLFNEYLRWKNPFKVGFEAPPEFDEMYAAFSTWGDLPDYLSGSDYLEYGIRGNEIPDEEVSERLFEQYQMFLLKISSNE